MTQGTKQPEISPAEAAIASALAVGMDLVLYGPMGSSYADDDGHCDRSGHVLEAGNADAIRRAAEQRKIFEAE